MKVSNPLTIIAIFAGLAEALATVALLGLPHDLQATFIYFVMAFPTTIVILFFLVLYFKNNVLYAPGDYQDPEHYLRVNGSDIRQVLTSEISKGSFNQKQVEALGDATNVATGSSALASKAINFAEEITNELFSPALELLVLQLLQKPGHVRDEIVSQIESEKLKTILLSVLDNIKSKVGHDSYNRPIQMTEKTFSG